MGNGKGKAKSQVTSRKSETNIFLFVFHFFLSILPFPLDYVTPENFSFYRFLLALHFIPIYIHGISKAHKVRLVNGEREKKAKQVK